MPSLRSFSFPAVEPTSLLSASIGLSTGCVSHADACACMCACVQVEVLLLKSTEPPVRTRRTKCAPKREERSHFTDSPNALQILFLQNKTLVWRRREGELHHEHTHHGNSSRATAAAARCAGMQTTKRAKKRTSCSCFLARSSLTQLSFGWRTPPPPHSVEERARESSCSGST